jgi:hypothetical protein
MMNRKEAERLAAWIQEEARVTGVLVKAIKSEPDPGAPEGKEALRVVVSFHGEVPADKLHRLANRQQARVGVTHEGDVMLRVA